MVAPWSYYHWDGTHDHLSSVVKAVTQPGRHSINSHYKSFRPVTASGAPLSVNNSTDFQTVISPTLILQWTVKPFPSSPSFPWLTSSQGCEWRIKPLHRCQTLCYVHFKNTQLHEDKLEGESHSLPPMHAIYTVCWCQCGGNVRAKPTQIPQDLYLFHALMLVNIAVTIWLTGKWVKGSAHQHSHTIAGVWLHTAAT